MISTHLQDNEHLTVVKKIEQFYHAPVIKFWNNVVRAFHIYVLLSRVIGFSHAVYSYTILFQIKKRIMKKKRLLTLTLGS